MTRRWFHEWLLVVSFWLVYMLGISSVTMVGITIVLDLALKEAALQQDPLLQYTISGYQYLEGALFAVLFGTFFFVINRFLERPWLNRKSTGYIIMIKSLAYLGAVLLVFGVIYLVLTTFGIMPMGYEDWALGLIYRPDYIIPIGWMLGFGVVLTHFILQVSKKYGEGNMFPILLGRYHKPVMENRIFMFIDLRSSTTYAEMLGHLRYSQMIQDCFRELNHIVDRFKADIYQYVGDEIVLTWKEAEGFRNLNCIEVFFTFSEILERRRSYFEKTYGFLPEFKVGLNAGEITVAEVGIIKRDIAYHGDTINTAARVQDLCNKYEKRFLATDRILSNVGELNGYKAELIGDLTLRGKSRTVKVCSIEPATKPSA